MLFRSRDFSALGLVLSEVPGATPKEAGLRIDRVQLAVRPRLDPGDVVAHGPDLPALEAGGWDEHREVRLATGARERRADVGLLPLRGLDAQDQHVLCQPALVARHARRDPEREALLSQQRIAAVAAPEGPDATLFREMRDVGVLGVARPGDVLVPGAERDADGVEAGHEVAVVAQRLERRTSHPGHDAHVDDDVGRVRDLDPEVRDVGSQRAHAEGDHVHRAPLHAACRELPQLLVELPGIDPVVGRPRIATAARSDERAVLDPRHVFRVRTAEIAVRPLLRVEGNERACVHHLLAEAIALLFRAVTPLHGVRPAEQPHLLHPLKQSRVPCRAF